MSAASPAPRWSDLRKRALSAAILAPAALACIWFGAEAWTAFIAIAIALLTWEWVHLCGLRTRAAPGIAVPLAVGVACGFAVLEQPRVALLLLVMGFLATWAMAERWRHRRELDQPALGLAAGVIYIGLAGVALIELRHDGEAGRYNVLFLFLVVWASDIGAYAAGRTLGGPKLAPAISPSKTWSGAAGGLAASVAVGVAAAMAMAPGSPWRAVLVAALLGLATQAGDLLESWIKRRYRRKDSSALIPGHGGVLDRLDGLLAAAPVAALLSFQLGYGNVLWR
jgi:phosphatidate cytidylyltransferase